MNGKIRTRLALLVALAALTAVLVPATLAFGSHGSFEGNLPNGVVLLTMGNGANADKVTYSQSSTVVQNLQTANNDCTKINATLGAGPLLVVTAGGTGVSLGEAKNQIGVKSAQDGSGENCVRTGDGEILKIALGSSPALKSNVMGGFDLDIQLKFNSTVVARTYRNNALQDTLQFSGTGSSDNGPDSLDNFRWAHVAATGKEFDRIELQALAGTFSLGGGQNIAETGIFDTTKKASQFALGPIFDGEITCGDDEPIAEDGENTSGTVTMHSENKGAGWLLDPNCDLKPYNAEIQDAGLAFVPLLAGTTARYTIEIDVQDQEITVDGTGHITSLVANYNEDGDLTFPATSPPKPLQHCLGQPVLGGPGYDAFWTQTDVGLLPDGEKACWYHASADPTGVDVGIESWGIYFEDDPGFSFR